MKILIMLFLLTSVSFGLKAQEVGGGPLTPIGRADIFDVSLSDAAREAAHTRAQGRWEVAFDRDMQRIWSCFHTILAFQAFVLVHGGTVSSSSRPARLARLGTSLLLLGTTSKFVKNVVS